MEILLRFGSEEMMSFLYYILYFKRFTCLPYLKKKEQVEIIKEQLSDLKTINYQQKIITAFVELHFVVEF